MPRSAIRTHDNSTAQMEKLQSATVVLKCVVDRLNDDETLTEMIAQNTHTHEAMSAFCANCKQLKRFLWQHISESVPGDWNCLFLSILFSFASFYCGKKKRKVEEKLRETKKKPINNSMLVFFFFFSSAVAVFVVFSRLLCRWRSFFCFLIPTRNDYDIVTAIMCDASQLY